MYELHEINFCDRASKRGRGNVASRYFYCSGIDDRAGPLSHIRDDIGDMFVNKFNDGFKESGFAGADCDQGATARLTTQAWPLLRVRIPRRRNAVTRWIARWRDNTYHSRPRGVDSVNIQLSTVRRATVIAAAVAEKEQSVRAFGGYLHRP